MEMTEKIVKDGHGSWCTCRESCQ